MLQKKFRSPARQFQTGKMKNLTQTLSVYVIKLSDLYNISLDQLLKGDEAMIEHLEKSTNIVKSNEKLIAAIIANVLLMISFILFNGLIIENHYLIMGSSILGITATCMLFYQIIKKL